ncbi:hypothetical protein T492DRAFT_889343 [Pavlovales sp. CCMP2436]|nr:hypothetical protein T492DRAFT_889343 [Pavlovales sp. CCMP2436]
MRGAVALLALSTMAGVLDAAVSSARPARLLPVSRMAHAARAGVCMKEEMFGSESIELRPGDKAMVVGVQIKQLKYKTLRAEWKFDDSLDELERLCETAGLVVTSRESQAMQHPSPSTFVGTGKLEEIVATALAAGVNVVVFDDELSPAQGAAQKALLILQIFAQRARSRVAKLQVQVAQMKYMLPRLTSYMTQVG